MINYFLGQIKIGGQMNYKKYLILLLSIFMLIACKKLPVDDVQESINKKIIMVHYI